MFERHESFLFPLAYSIELCRTWVIFSVDLVKLVKPLLSFDIYFSRNDLPTAFAHENVNVCWVFCFHPFHPCTSPSADRLLKQLFFFGVTCVCYLRDVCTLWSKLILKKIAANIFMFLQGKYLTSLFAKVVSIPQQILTPIIVIFCFAGAYSVNSSYFDLSVALVFGVMAWFMRKLELPAVPVLLGMVLGNMTETNFRRALLISDGSPRIFVSSVYCWIFIALIVVVILGILRGKMKEAKNTKAEQ